MKALRTCQVLFLLSLRLLFLNDLWPWIPALACAFLAYPPFPIHANTLFQFVPNLRIFGNCS